MVPGIHIGCSGYYYPHWVGAFYPEGTKRGGFFEFYAGRFSTVELNTTFYHLPRAKQVASWRDRSPDGFLFTVKAPRLITHMKKLRECRGDILLFMHLVKPLKEAGKLGAVLFQTPPKLGADTTLLEEFVSMLPVGYRYAFEFRNPSWEGERTAEVLGARQTCMVVSSGKDGWHRHGGSDGSFSYYRMHGPGARYASNYTEETLRALAERLLEARRTGTDEQFVYFNNDFGGYAPSNAAALRELVGERANAQ